MGKTIKHIRTATFVTILIELILIGVFCTLYFTNIFGFYDLQSMINDIYIIIGASVLIIFNCFFIWISVIKVSRLRQKTDLHAAEVVGSDVQEAYNFAKVGLAVTDDDGIVIWTNDLFTDRHLNILDENIISWLPDLAPLLEPDNVGLVVKVVINSRNYDVKYLPEAGLWIFKDTTDFEEISRYSIEQAPVVGVLTIDNYSDATHGENEDFNDVVTKVKNAVFEYTKQYKVLIRKFKDDSYSLLCNYESLKEMKEDGFSIVDKVRQIGLNDGVPLTLSIGLANDFPDVIKLNELAFEALDIAMSRGGDQVVLSSYGRDMEFIGGKTEAQEKRNRVRIRVLADSLMSLIRGAKNVFIMGHTMADMDALGSCLGVKAMCDRVEVPARIVIDLKYTETKTRSAFTSSFSKEELDQIRITPKEALDQITPDTLVVVVDVHTKGMTMAPALLDHATKVVVIDHHRRAEDYIESPVLNHIDPAASSACELVTEFLKFASINPKIDLPQTYATIMLSGIFLDSNYFRSKQTGIRTFEACTVLKEYGADNALADDFLKEEKEEYFEVEEIVKNMRFYTSDVVYVVADPEIVYDSATLSKVANQCLTLKGIRASFVIGRVNKEVKISCRSTGSISVQLIAEAMGGGGHLTMAAASFRNSTVSEIEQKLLATLNTTLNAARNDALTRKITEEDAV